MESRQPPSSTDRKTILVVDADPQSLRIVDVSLRRAGFDVRAATDGTVAAAVLDRVPPPDLVIADADLPGIDGFELCRRTKSSTRTGAIPFIFLARPHAAHKMRAFELGADDFLSKPVFVTEVVARVSALLQRHERERLASRDVVIDHASGSLANLSTIDLLQTIATNGKSGVLHLRSAAGVPGEIYFRRGAVVDAEVGRLSGSDAVYRLLSWTDGRFEIEWRNIRRRDAVALPAPALLMEGMRRLDEWTRITQQLPPLETVFEVDYRLLAERLADIPDEVNGILRLFDGLRTAMQVIDDCGLADLDALTVIGKLNSEGLIRNMTAKSVEDDKTGPDLEGWLGQPLEGASPPVPAPPPMESESRLRRVSDTHASSLRSDPGAAEPRKTPTAPVPDWRDRASHDHPAPSRDASGVPVLRPDEPAVVIPFPTATPAPNRQTMVSATGGPAAAVAGEISNGVATPSVSGGAMSAAPSSPSPSSAASAAPPLPMTPAPEPSFSTPRSTDPGLGPVPPVPAPRVAGAPTQPVASSVTPPASLAAPPATLDEHPMAAASPPTSRRDSASSRVPDLPFSDSASRWMTEGDEIHSHKSRAEALDEMGLPSRFRGWALLAVVVVVAGGSPRTWG